MPGSASMAYKMTSRPTMGVGVGGERRAMGDSSHYEEIAVIGNGELRLSTSIYIYQNVHHLLDPSRPHRMKTFLFPDGIWKAGQDSQFRHVIDSFVELDPL